MAITEEIDPIEKQTKERAAAKIAAERAAYQADREAHRNAIAREAEAAQAELADVMGQLDKREQRQVRLSAIVRALDEGKANQSTVDRLCLRLARYMVMGLVQ